MNGERLEDSSSDLVRRAQRAGETTEAFAALVEQFEKTALAVAYAACGDANQAADVVQEAFLRAWQRLRELQHERKFGPWLCTIVRNIATDSRRRRRATRDVQDVADETSAVEKFDQSDQIAWALRRLDELSRTIVVLRYYEDLSSIEIAELVGSTPAAVDMRLSRARRTLRDVLSESRTA